MEIKVNEIYAFKMTSGQEIVAKIENIDDTYYHVLTPLTIGQGKHGMEFLQAMFCAEFLAETAMIKSSVAFVSPARPDVKASYEESVKPRSGLLTPQPRQIITG